jgi:hypothetical protein
MKKPQQRFQGAAVELWGAKVPLSTIRNQLKVFERTLRRVPVFSKANGLNHIKSRKPMSGRLRKISTTCPPSFRKSLHSGGENGKILVFLYTLCIPTKI